MNRLFTLPLIFVSVSFGYSALAQETAILRATFQYDGDPPKLDPIEPRLDRKFCGNVAIPDERLVVNPDNRGIKNVLVYVFTGRRGTELPDLKHNAETRVLKTVHCRFEPHILIAQKGDQLRVQYEDPVGHNANISFFNNGALGFTLPPGAPLVRSLDEAEPAPVPVQCNIHPWMAAYLVVLDHPFAAVSGENGMLEILGLPVGQRVIFRAFHESARLREVERDGITETWKNSKFEHVLQSGVNDLGIIKIPASSFQLD